MIEPAVCPTQGGSLDVPSGEGASPSLWGPDGQEVDGWHSDRALCAPVNVAAVEMPPVEGSSPQ